MRYLKNFSFEPEAIVNTNFSTTKDLSSIERHLESARTLQQQALNSEAIAQYLKALAIDSNTVLALNELGKLYEAEKQFDRAVTYYQQATELQPNESVAYVRLARALMGQNNPTAAIVAYQKAIALKPDSRAWVYHGLGDALIENERTEEAIAAYRKALQQQPTNPNTIKRKLDLATGSIVENPLVAIAKNIQQEAPYTGGPVQSFEVVGRDTIITLLQNGLRPDHKILDLGCGALRLGYWIVRLVDRGNYYAIEPNFSMLETGKKYSLGAELIRDKQPQFSTNSDCDFSVFGVQFDFVVARSIFTHTTPALLRQSLKSFKDNSNQNAVMLASYWSLDYSKPGENGDRLPLEDARFIRVVTYSLDKIQSWAAEFGLKVSQFQANPTINEQIWLKFEHL